MKTGFVILNYNSWQMTSALAQKAASYKNIDAVVVVDNGSTDDSYKSLQRMEHPKIYVVQSGKNGGYSYGNNYGAKVCEKMGMEILFFSNPDVRVEEIQIQKILEQFVKTDYSVLSGVEYGQNGRISQPSLWKRMDYWADCLDCFFLGRKFGRKSPGIKLDKNVEVQEAELVKGAFLAVRLKDFMEAGGFDEQVFLYCEERILSKRLERLGRKIGVVTSAEYIHTHSASIQREYQKTSDQIQMLYRSRIYYHRKYNNLKGVKYIFLLGAMKISVLEYKIWDFTCLKKKHF